MKLFANYIPQNVSTANQNIQNHQPKSGLSPLTENSPEAKAFKEAEREANQLKMNFINMMGSTLYMTGKMTSKLASSKYIRAGGLAAEVIGTGINKGLNRGY